MEKTPASVFLGSIEDSDALSNELKGGDLPRHRFPFAESCLAEIKKMQVYFEPVLVMVLPSEDDLSADRAEATLTLVREIRSECKGVVILKIGEQAGLINRASKICDRLASSIPEMAIRARRVTNLIEAALSDCDDIERIMDTCEAISASSEMTRLGALIRIANQPHLVINKEGSE